MQSAPVLVLPRNATGFTGEPDPNVRVYTLTDLDVALNNEYDYDAHVAAYRVENENRCVRIRKQGYWFVEENGGKIVADYLFVDVDNPNHAPWDSIEDIGLELRRVRATPLGKKAGFWATRHGYRLFWRLPKSIEIKFYESLVKQTIDRLRIEGIEADEKCTDWTHVFRLPHATPEGSSKPIRLPKDLTHDVLPFWPNLTESRMPRVEANLIGTVSETHPPVRMPTDEEIELLAGEPDLYRRVKGGKPLAEPGTRQRVMVHAVGVVARKMTKPTPEAVFNTLAYSVAVDKRKPAQGAPKGLDELWRIVVNTVGKELTERAEQARVVLELSELVEKREAARRKKLPAPNRPPAESADALTPELVVEDVPGVEGEIADDFEPPPEHAWRHGHLGASLPPDRRIIVLLGRAYYVLNEQTAFYHGPFDGISLPGMVEKFAPNSVGKFGGIRNDKGSFRTTSEILARFGTEAEKVIAVIGKRGIEYDSENKIIIEGVASIRPDLRPVYNSQIHRWLMLLGDKYQDKLLDWLATFPDLKQPTCGLYIRSTGGTGKGMLAAGLARLWGTSPTMYANIIGTHNDAIAHCPLIWGDEELPPSQFGKTPSAVFRTLVGNSEFNLRRMYSPAATIKGCLRLLVTANNDNALKIEEDLTPDDYEAIVQRIGYIHSPSAAKLYLQSLGGRATTEAWVEGDGIAQHVLWLQKNRTVQPGKRFLVDGWESDLHKNLQSSSGVAGMVVEVIAYAVAQKFGKAGSSIYPGFVIGNGFIYVTISGVYDAWEAALGPKARQAVKQRIRSALRQLSPNVDPCKVTTQLAGGRQETVSMWAVRPKEIIEVIGQYQLGDPDVVQNAVNTRTVFVR